MIQVKTKVWVGDNSGVRQVECIKAYKRKQAKAGQLSLFSFKKVWPFRKLQKGLLSEGIVVRSKKEQLRKDGSFIRYSQNSVVLLKSKKKEPKAKRIVGPVSEELRRYGFTKITRMANKVI